LPDFVTRPPSGPYRSLNPATKLVIALSTAAIAFAVREWSGPVAMLGVVIVTTAVARLGRSVLKFTLATIPLVVSILLVNTFLFPGATDVLIKIGPFAATSTGLAAALQASLRVIAFALSVAVFSLTTPTDDLLSDLERRGLGRRAIFIVGSAIGTIPRMGERASEIIDSQRARGLDTEGSITRRLRGLVPLAGPMISSALSEVEERSMALEARGFSAPARRTTLRSLPDSAAQRGGRWLLVVGTAVLVALSVGGVIRLP
jgi:energy-coupling factor transport system permease protein